MKIQAGQAVYGERNKGHALLARSPAAIMARDIVNLMDIQGTVPPGIVWPAYWSGQVKGDRYILSYTAPDPEAARPGMVRSRALICALDDLVRLESIGPALALLAQPVDQGDDLNDVILTNESTLDAGHIGLANALMMAGEEPVVWALEASAAGPIAALWRQLWPAARREFSFGFGFAPQDLGERPPTMIVTPPGLAGRWSGFHMVRSDPQPLDAGAALLAGHAAGTPVSTLLHTLDAQLSRIGDLHHLVEVAKALDGIEDLAGGIDALRLIGFLSPAAGSGGETKGQILAQTIPLFNDAPIAMIRMARNLDLMAMPEPDDFWEGLTRWAATSLWRASGADIARLLTEALNAGPTARWRSAIWQGVTDRLVQPDSSIAKTIWAIVSIDPDLLQPILSRCPSIETLLADTVPTTLKAEAAQPLLATARAVEWIQLHGALAAAALPPRQAVQHHLEMTAADAASIARAVARASKRIIVGLGATIDDDRVRTIAARTVADQPTLLAPLDIAQAGWRALWEAGLELNRACWSGPKQPQHAFRWLIEAHSSGASALLPLMSILADTPLADLSDQPERATLWPLLDRTCRERLLIATARSWTERFLAGTIDTPAEPPLAEQLGRYPLDDQLLRRATGDITMGCRLFRCVPAFDENRFLDWARRTLNTATVGADDADALGRLIAIRSWPRGAQLLVDLTLDGRNDVRPAIMYFVEQLGIFTQYRLDMWLEKSPAAAKWRTLEELGLELYGIGPGEHGLWERAGGKKADIPIAPSGREAWRQVVAGMEQGKRRISPRKLIDVMAEDFPDNPTLKKMRWDSFFR